MKNRIGFKIIALFALILGVFGINDNSKAQVMEVGLTAGMSSYYGDLNSIKPFNQVKFGFGGMVRYYQSTRWAFRFAYSNMTVTATDEKVGVCPERKRGFVTNLNDFSLIAEFNFFDYWTGSRRNFISPYLFAGVGVVAFNPKALDGTELCNVLTDVNGYVTETDGNGGAKASGITQNNIRNGSAKYNKCAFEVPFGLGVKFSVNRRVGLALEWRVHWAWTDWIDDCSGYYPLWDKGDPWAQYADPSGNLQDENGCNQIKYVQRGDSVKFDYYSFLNFTVAYKFNLPQSKKCNADASRKYYTY